MNRARPRSGCAQGLRNELSRLGRKPLRDGAVFVAKGVPRQSGSADLVRLYASEHGNRSPKRPFIPKNSRANETNLSEPAESFKVKSVNSEFALKENFECGFLHTVH